MIKKNVTLRRHKNQTIDTKIARSNWKPPIPSISEWQNISLPSLTDVTLPPIAAEIQAIKEQMEVMMNALKGRVSSDLDDLVNQTDSPFTTSVNSFPLSHKFRLLQMDSYDGVNDPLDHLETFKE